MVKDVATKLNMENKDGQTEHKTLMDTMAQRSQGAGGFRMWNLNSADIIRSIYSIRRFFYTFVKSNWVVEQTETNIKQHRTFSVSKCLCDKLKKVKRQSLMNQYGFLTWYYSPVEMHKEAEGN